MSNRSPSAVHTVLHLREGIGLFGVGRAHPDEASLTGKAAGGVGVLADSLLGHHPPHTADQQLARCQAQLGTNPLAAGRIETEPSQVDAAADHLCPTRAHHAAQGPSVCGVLIELGVGEQRCEALDPQDEGLLQHAVVRTQPESVAGVDDDGNSGRASQDPSEHAGLGIVRVQDVQLQPAQRAEQLTRGGEVLGDVPGTGQRLQRHMTYAELLDCRHIGSRRREAVHLEATLHVDL